MWYLIDRFPQAGSLDGMTDNHKKTNDMNYNFRFNSFLSKILASGIALLGFSCSSAEDDDILYMYGCPTGKFTIKGKVSSEDGKALQDATLRVTLPELDSYPHPSLEGKSDETGNYSLQGANVPHEKLKVVCVPNDESLAADSTTVDMKYVNKNGEENSWYVGEAEATVDFILKKKENK